MVKFLDGPAAGVDLPLRRIPIYLRVVRSRRGDWDALDQLEDEPKLTETITVYRRRDDREITKYHLCFRSRNKRESGYYWNADYSVFGDQPSDDQVRTTEAWQEWVSRQMVLPMPTARRPA